MATSEQGFVGRLVDEEIRRLVAAASETGSILSAMDCAAQILRAYAGSNLSQTEIADRIMLEAATAGLAVEIGPPGKDKQAEAAT